VTEVRPARPVRWAVVGGGMLGAVAARRLRAEGAEVTLFEAAPTLGGLASAASMSVPGRPAVVWDRFYHVILGADRRLLALLDEIDAGEVVWAKSKAACYSGGKALPASSAAELFTLPFLGWLAKIRLVLTVLVAVVFTSERHYDQITSARWLRRWSGRQATERLWLPLLRAKLGEAAERASATFIWSTIRRLVMARFQGRNGGDLFGHVAGGYASVLATLARELVERGVEVRTGARVAAIRPTASGGLGVEFADDAPLTFDRVLVTTASPIASRLLPDLTAAEHARLQAVEYLGVVCPSVLLRRPVTGSYITYVTDAAPFTAVIEMTALIDPAELDGHTLVYLPLYTSPRDGVFDDDDGTIRARFLPAFLSMYGLDEADVVSFTVAKARYVMPVPTPGYPARVPSVATSVPGLFTIGSAQITTGTLNIEQTLQLLEGGWPQLDHGPVRDRTAADQEVT
jgi:protoporphyrinogen oxidase